MGHYLSEMHAEDDLVGAKKTVRHIDCDTDDGGDAEYYQQFGDIAIELIDAEIERQSVESEEESPNENTEPNPYDSAINITRIDPPKFHGNIECDGDVCRLVRPTESETEESDP